MEVLCQQLSYLAPTLVQDALQSQAFCASSPNCQGHRPRLQTPRGRDTASPAGPVRTPDPSTLGMVCTWLSTPCLGWTVWQQLDLDDFSMSECPGPVLLSVSGITWWGDMPSPASEQGLD